MAWIDLANNQCVSFTDLQTSGVPLNSGQSATTSNQLITKSELITKYNVSSFNINSLASNQAVQKSLIYTGTITCGNSRDVDNYGLYDGTVDLYGFGSGLTETMPVLKNSYEINISGTTGTSVNATFTIYEGEVPMGGILDDNGTYQFPGVEYKRIVIKQGTSVLYDSNWFQVYDISPNPTTTSVTFTILNNTTNLTVETFVAGGTY